MNYSMIRYTIGWLLVFETAFFAVPLITAAVYRELAFFAFLGAGAITLVLGLVMTYFKPKNTAIYAREGFVIVALSWIVMSIFGALPFLFTGSTSSFIDAFFETVSGFTTTGSSIFGDVESLPRAIIMWRSFTHWVGGMGILVFVMAFLPLSGGHNMHLMKAESPGPDVSKLVPRVKNTALILYLIYFVMTLVQFIILVIADMPVFEAVNTAFATAGTGGFGFKNDSFASATAAQQIIVTVFMFLFSINFNSYYLVLKCKFRDALTSEVVAFTFIVLSAIGLITVNVMASGHFESVGEALRHAAFSVSSLISTTGFATADFDLWPEFSKVILLLVMFIGACAGSTGGGIKVSRIIILIKGALRELSTSIHPRQVKKITIDKKAIDREIIRSANAYIVAYLIIFVCSVLLVSIEDQSFMTSFSAVTATLNNIGPGFDAVGPTCNFGHLSAFSKIVLSLDMLIGRLELFPMLILFTPSTYKKNS